MKDAFRQHVGGIPLRQRSAAHRAFRAVDGLGKQIPAQKPTTAEAAARADISASGRQTATANRPASCFHQSHFSSEFWSNPWKSFRHLAHPRCCVAAIGWEKRFPRDTTISTPPMSAAR